MDAKQMQALEQFKTGKLSKEELMKVLAPVANAEKPLKVEAIAWDGKPVLRFNHDASKKPGPWNGKSIGARLIRQILDNADVVRAACDEADKLASTK